MKILALDANSIINRAFYGIRLLSNKNGVFTNAIFGFMNILLKLQQDTKPDLIIAAFDLKAPTFRHKLYSDYKAGRKAMPDELRMQIPIMKDVLKAFGCAVMEQEGFEADDILGTIAKQCEEAEYDCVIATGDRDSLQLVSERVSVYLAATKSGQPQLTIYTPEKVFEDYGVTPKGLIEIKALQGDSSDNIPGVQGVGPKTAGGLIIDHGSIDAIYENIDALDLRDTLKQKLLTDKDNAFLSRKLGTINCEVPLTLPKSAATDNEELLNLLTRLEMFKLIERLGLKDEQMTFGDSPIPAKPAVTVEFEQVDVIPNGAVVYAENGRIFAKSDGKFYCSDNLDLSETHGIITHNCKSLFHTIGGTADIAFDTMLAAYLINPDKSDFSLSRFANEYPVGEFGGENGEVVQNLELIERILGIFLEKIEENGQKKLLFDIEIPLSSALFSMEKDGFLIDKNGVFEFGEKLEKQAQELSQRIFEIIGYEFNLNSPKQLGEALFDKLGLPHEKKTKTGYSTSAEVLEKLKDKSEAVELLLSYRSVTKLKSTYCDGLLKLVDENGRIHSTFNQVETRTGRISSSEPNLQNIPVRTTLGREMRKFFIAREGYVLVDADYSQIELRVLASIADDTKMKAAFLANEDIHTATAAEVFGLPQEVVTEDLRSKAKAVNFGIVYGIGAFSLSKDIKVSVAEAKQYIEGYLSTYSGIKDYLEKAVEGAKKDGFVSTIFGRRRYLPELVSSNFNMRSFGERVAKNMPIQGAAADIIKIAMVRVCQRLRQENLDARLILQVHDELIIEARADIAEKVGEMLKTEMEAAVSIGVPLTADVNYGKTWYEAK